MWQYVYGGGVQLPKVLVLADHGFIYALSNT